MTIFNADEIRETLETAFPIPVENEYEDAFY